MSRSPCRCRRSIRTTSTRSSCAGTSRRARACERARPLVTLETTKTTFDVDAPEDGFASLRARAARRDRRRRCRRLDRRHGWRRADTRAAAALARSRRRRSPTERFTRKALQAHEGAWPDSRRLPGDARSRRRCRRSAPAAARVAPRPAPATATARTRSSCRHRKSPRFRPCNARAEQSSRARSRLHSPVAVSTSACAAGREHGPYQLARAQHLRGARLAARLARAQRFLRATGGRGAIDPSPSASPSISAARCACRSSKARRSFRCATWREPLRDLSLRYMRDELTIDDVTGGTFTITDLSGDGVVHFVPVLNERQSAILGLCAPRK